MSKGHSLVEVRQEIACIEQITQLAELAGGPLQSMLKHHWNQNTDGGELRWLSNAMRLETFLRELTQHSSLLGSIAAAVPSSSYKD
jgi:hypothetical protein